MDLNTAKIFLDLAISMEDGNRKRELVLTVIELLAIDLAHSSHTSGKSKASSKAYVMDPVSERIDSLFN